LFILKTIFYGAEIFPRRVNFFAKKLS